MARTPNLHSISQLMHHCSQTNNLRQLYAHVLRTGLFANLVLTYTATTPSSHKILKCLTVQNPLPFNSIVSHFSRNGPAALALRTFSFMHSSGVFLDSYALCCSLKSASRLKNGPFGKMVHAHVAKSGWLASVFVGSALVDFYAKVLCVDDAAKVFDEIPVRNAVCANALISGFVEAEMWGRGIEVVRRMPVLSLGVDSFTLSAALRACSGLCALDVGKQIHGNVIRRVYDLGSDVFLQSLLIEMYGKCGLVDCAKNVFDMVGYYGGGERRRDVVLWTSMLGVYGRSGNYMEVIRLFKDMLKGGMIRPDEVVFLTVISACGHTGQVDLGMEYFESMTRDYGLVPGQEHYSCLVDLLCRAGELDRACKLVSEMPYSGDESVSMWGALLNACSECGDVNLGRLVAERALQLEPNNVGVYVLLSNLYASHGMWAEIEQLRELMKRKGLKKEIGWSSVGAAGVELSHR